MSINPEILLPKINSILTMKTAPIVFKTSDITEKNIYAAYSDHSHSGYSAYSDHSNSTSHTEYSEAGKYTQTGYKAYNDYNDYTSWFSKNEIYKEKYGRYGAYAKKFDGYIASGKYTDKYYKDGYVNGVTYDKYAAATSGQNYSYEQYSTIEYFDKQETLYSAGGCYYEVFKNSGYRAYNNHKDSKGDTYSLSSKTYTESGYNAYSDHSDSNSYIAYEQSGIHKGTKITEEMLIDETMIFSIFNDKIENTKGIETTNVYISNRTYKMLARYDSFIKNFSNKDILKKANVKAQFKISSDIDSYNLVCTSIVNINIPKKEDYSKNNTLFNLIYRFVTILNNNLAAYECELIDVPKQGDEINIKYINNIISKYNKINNKISQLVPGANNNVNTLKEIVPGEDIYRAITKMIEEDLEITLY